MAILNNLLVKSSSRFIGTSYFQDVSISGTATLSSLSLSGNLSVTGNTTVGGTLGVTGNATFGNITATGTVILSRTQDLSGTANNSPALIVGGTATSAHMELDANEIHAKATGTTVADLYLNNQGGKVYLSGNSVYASGSAFVATTGNIVTLNSTNVNVTNNLRANHYDLQTVAQLGGSFYVSPTVKFPNSGTTLAVAKSGTTLTLTITDSSITSATMAGVVWTAGSGVKVSGTINGVVTGTMDGTVSSINTSSHVLTLSVSGENSGNVQASPSGSPYTASQFKDLSVMLYTRKQDGTSKMINTASGAIASFTDGGNNVPLKQLVVDIEPVQDLHGYDAPWVGGGGKNLLNNTATTKTTNGVTFTVNSDGTITANGTATADAQIQIGFSGLPGNYKFTGCPSGGGSGKYDVYAWDSTTNARPKKWNGTTESVGDFGNTLQEIQIPSGHSGVIVCRVSRNYTANNIVFKPMIVASTVSDITYAPYSNICPITGHTSAVVTRTSWNLCDKNSVVDGMLLNNGTIYQSDTWKTTDYFPVKGDKVCLSWESTSGYYQGRLCFYSQNKELVSYDSYSAGDTYSHTFDIPFEAKYARMSWSVVVGDVSHPRNNVRINLSATDLGYTEYFEPETVTIDLDGTRYGGTLDVGTGVMTVTHKCVTFDGVTSGHAVTSVGSKESTDPYNFYQPHSDGYLFKGEVIGGSGWVSTGAMINHGMIYSHGAVDNSKSQTYHLACYVGGGGTVLQPRIFIPLDAGIDTVAKCNDWLAQQYANGTPVQYIYPLAEPFTVQLPRTEVRTLSGYNNIWSNTGDTNVIYESSQVDSTNNYNVGIWMNCYDQANSSSTIRVYDGSSRWPNVFLGNMTNADLPRVNGNEPYGYGLYSDNVFLRGIISATGGLIGNWTIGTTGMFYNSDAPGSTSITMIPGGTTASTTSIGGSSGSKSWIFTGKNLFGIDTTGKLYASSAEISGKITATSGSIAGWRIESTYLASGTATHPATNTLLLSPAGTSSSYTVAGTAKSGWMITAGTTFGVNKDGGVYATSGTIGGCSIVDGTLEIPAANITGTLSAAQISAGALSRNLMINTLNPVTTPASQRPRILGQVQDTAVTASTLSVATHGIRVTNTGAVRTYIRFGNSTASSGSLNGLEPGHTYTMSFDAKCKLQSSATGTANTTTHYFRIMLYDDKDTTGTFKLDQYENIATLSQANKGQELTARCEFTFTIPDNVTILYFICGSNLTTASHYAAGDYIELSNIMLQEAAGASAWCPADEDLYAASLDAAKTATNYLYFDSTNGLVVSQTGAVGTGYNTQITSTGMNIRNGTTTLASYGSSIILGKIANGVTRVQIDNDSLDVISRDNNGTDTTIATFGQTARIGSESGRNITINENGLTFNNNNSRAFYIGVESRVAGKSYLSETIVFHKSSGSMTQDNKTYYLLTTVPTDRTVTEVGWLYLDEGDGEEVLHAADDFHIDDWIIDNDKLWIHDDYIDDYDGRSFNYIYSSSASSIVDPYCVIGTYKYSSTNIAGSMSFAQGKDCLATGQTSTAIGYSTTSKGVASFSCGNQSEAQADYSFAGGFMSTASGKYSLAYGYKATASGDCSTAFGTYTTASGDWSTAFGHHTTASGNWSTAFGTYTTAGNWSTAFGGYTTASGSYSTAYGYKATASGSYSTAFGYNTTASNGYSTAFGDHTTASGNYSTAFGRYTKANMSGQTAIGTYNIEDTTPSSAVHPSGTAYGNYAFIIGNGKGDNTRSNALTVDWKGNVAASGKVADADGPLGVKVAIHKFTIAVSASGTGSGSFTLSTAEASGYLTTVITEVWPQSTWTNANANVSRVERSGNNINVHLSSMSAQTYNISAEVLYRG